MKQFSWDFLDTFKTIPNSCVYAIISDSNMTCIVSHSNNLQSSIGAILDANKVQGNDARLLILDVLDDLEYKLLLCERHKLELEVAGYKIVNTRQYINYKVSVQYSKKGQNILVVLYNKRRDRKIVGKFNNINDANSFVTQYYSGSIVMPVYAIGDNRYIN